MSFIRAGSVVCLLGNERHALIPSVCGRVDIHSDHNRFKGDKMVDVIKFSKKIISVGFQPRHIMHKRLENGIIIFRNMFSKCHFRRYYMGALGLGFLGLGC